MTYPEYVERFNELVEELKQMGKKVGEMKIAGTANDHNPEFLRLRERHGGLAKDMEDLNRRFFGNGVDD